MKIPGSVRCRDFLLWLYSACRQKNTVDFSCYFALDGVKWWVVIF